MSESDQEELCPNCNRMARIIFVHGHWQCSRCGQVVIDCCDGGQQE